MALPAPNGVFGDTYTEQLHQDRGDAVNQVWAGASSIMGLVTGDFVFAQSPTQLGRSSSWTTSTVTRNNSATEAIAGAWTFNAPVQVNAAITATGAVTAFNVVSTGATNSTFAGPLISNDIFISANQFRFNSVISPAALSGGVNNWNPTGLGDSNVVRIDASGVTSITGIQAQPSGSYLILINISATNTIDFIAESASSVAANRFVNNFSLASNGGMNIIWYDGVTNRWRPLLQF